MIVVSPPFIKLQFRCKVTQYWASCVICNSLSFILIPSNSLPSISASYHCLANREFNWLKIFSHEFSIFLNLFNWIIRNSDTASISLFTKFRHFQPWTLSSANHLSKQFSKLATQITFTCSTSTIKTLEKGKK